ncbi:Tat pathway signal protein [Arthrobacter sp. B10-11]|uniref:Tat pathway signal protein n=1 Tax=Arthrobacter sp. B10-11 TaxID=3081160 RepID=UPI0039895671
MDPQDPNKDPKKDPKNARSGHQGTDGQPAEAAGPGSSEPGWMTAPQDFTPQPHDPATGQLPPWQVPKPELRPELLNDSVAGSRGPAAGSRPPGAGKPGPVIDPFERERERETAARKKRSQRRTVVVGLGVTALLAGTITAIVASNEAEADYAQVCFNDETGERVEDTQCDNSSSAGRSSAIYAWYFYSRGSSVPAVGQNRSQYPSFTKTVPQGAKTSKGYSTKGGTVSRGGFGSSSKGGSTGG